MADFKDLDPQTRCFALVGQFLQSWALMEMSMQQTMGIALKIEITKLEILCANLAFYDKLHILRTLVDISDFTDHDKAKAKSKLRKLGNHSKKRNIVAHNLFIPDISNSGVEFQTIKARGEFQKPLIVWMPQHFDRERSLIHGYREFLDHLSECFNKHPIQPKRYVDALLPFIQSDWPVPMPRTIPQAVLSPLTQPTPVRPGSGPATPQTYPQKPDRPEE